MDLQIATWQTFFEEEFEKPYFLQLKKWIEMERSTHQVFPSEDVVFDAFYKTPYDRVKVVIVGQDPYHGLGQAHGLSFSVPKLCKVPPSLKNISKELNRDLDIPLFAHGNLDSWAAQGVFLLNSILTVRKNEPKSHENKGWEIFTDQVLKFLILRQDPVIFLLMGKKAQEKIKIIKESQSNHFFFETAHPSPYSAHLFIGCGVFSKINNTLKQIGKTPIDWRVL